MASTSIPRVYTSFTITQPFLGAPLQFQPALGSQELEELIDLYVIGTAAKQDKLSQVTIDFYNNATVDLNTGALTRTYDVFPSQWATSSFEQSPTLSQSSGLSPPIYTPSPASSVTFGDSGYGSFSMSPHPTNQGARAAKKAKKEGKKPVPETRLPGFSIMTKDGIDVTNSAGRGTKTKEQREHAHLMRIMKACDQCKRKKIRCDPSHRRSHNEMSRASTSTSTTKSSSPGRPDPSPSVSSRLSRGGTNSAHRSLPLFSPSNPIDDFVLFPEESAAWNDFAFPELETQDLAQFNFDINDIDLVDYSPMTTDQSFFSFEQSSFQRNNQPGYTPILSDQYGLDQWAEPSGSDLERRSQLQPSLPSANSGALDQTYQTSSVQDSANFATSAAFADNIWPDGFLDHLQVSQASPAHDSTFSSLTSDSAFFSSSSSARSSLSPNEEVPGSGQDGRAERQLSARNPIRSTYATLDGLQVQNTGIPTGEEQILSSLTERNSLVRLDSNLPANVSSHVLSTPQGEEQDFVMVSGVVAGSLIDVRRQSRKRHADGSLSQSGTNEGPSEITNRPDLEQGGSQYSQLNTPAGGLHELNQPQVLSSSELHIPRPPAFVAEPIAGRLQTSLLISEFSQLENIPGSQLTRRDSDDLQATVAAPDYSSGGMLRLLASILDVQYRTVILLAVLGFTASIISSSISFTTAALQLVIPILALSFLSGQATVHGLGRVGLGSGALLAAQLLFLNDGTGLLSPLRELCTEWSSGNSTSITVTKLLSSAFLVAYLPSLLSHISSSSSRTTMSYLVAATVTALSLISGPLVSRDGLCANQTPDGSRCDREGLSPLWVNENANGSRGASARWLDALMDWSPVVNVA